MPQWERKPVEESKTKQLRKTNKQKAMHTNKRKKKQESNKIQTPYTQQIGGTQSSKTGEQRHFHAKVNPDTYFFRFLIEGLFVSGSLGLDD